MAESKKYRYQDLRGPIPDDANADAYDFARKVESPEMEAWIQKVQISRRFGEFVVVDAGDHEVFRCTFKSGIMHRGEVDTYEEYPIRKPFKFRFKRSIHNRNVDFRKEQR